MKSKEHVLSRQDQVMSKGLFIVALLSASFIIMIAIFITIRGIMPFITDNDGLGTVSLINFLTDMTWLDGPTFVSTAYGAGFLIINTLYVVFLSLLLSFPIGVLTALFIAKIAPKRLAATMRTIVELMAAIPSIVYGLVGAGVMLPIIYNVATNLGFHSVGGSSTLATVIVLAFMSIPTITAVSEVSIRSVDKSIEHASLALGASHIQTQFKVVLIAAKSGIFASAILAVGRALGEATAVSLVAGNARSGPTFGLFDITSTITSTMLQGLKETTGIDYDIRFSLGILLMVVIVITNLTLNFVKRKVGSVHAS
ncbi:MAG: phosphate ABC transporter permease subunit PstC [Bacillota bacterium]